MEQATSNYIRLEQEKTVLKSHEKIVQQQYSCTIFSTGERVHIPGGGQLPGVDSAGSGLNIPKIEKGNFLFNGSCLICNTKCCVYNN